MPFTIFHIGPAILIGFLLFSRLDFVSFMISSVISDVEPLCIALFSPWTPLHGFFHSYLGATFLGVLTAVGVYFLRSWLSRILAWFKVQQEPSFKKMLYTSTLGVYFHVFLDSFLYAEMEPLYPLTGNPFFEVVGFGTTYGFCTASFIIGVILYVYKFIIRRTTQ